MFHFNKTKHLNVKCKGVHFNNKVLKRFLYRMDRISIPKAPKIGKSKENE